MPLPPVLAGAAHVITTLVPLIEVVGATGTPGVVAAIMAPMAEKGPHPYMFSTLCMTLYVAPLVILLVINTEFKV